MDKYEGIYRVEVNLTDNSDYSYVLAKSKGRKNFQADFSCESQGEGAFGETKEDDFSGSFEREITNQYEGQSRIEYENNLPHDQNNRLPKEYESRLPREYDYYAEEPQDRRSSELVDAGNIPLYQVGENNLYYGDKALVYRRARKKSGNFKGFCIRVIVSAALFFGVYGVSKLDTPFANQVNETIKKAITYDLDTNKDKELGEIKVVTQIKERQEQAKEEE